MPLSTLNHRDKWGARNGRYLRHQLNDTHVLNGPGLEFKDGERKRREPPDLTDHEGGGNTCASWFGNELLPVHTRGKTCPDSLLERFRCFEFWAAP